MEVSGQLYTLAALALGKVFPVPTSKEAGLSPEPLWMHWQRRKIPTVASNQTPILQLVTQSL